MSASFRACILEVLHENVSLRSALLRGSASDIAKLLNEFPKIREIVESDSFVQERCQNGYAEVSASIVDPEERKSQMERETDPEYLEFCEGNSLCRINDLGIFGDFEGHGNFDVKANIMVDGRVAGEVCMQLLPLLSRYNFHEMGDSISRELNDITTVFFSARGEPNRVKSVRQAYNNFSRTGVYTQEFLLYIVRFEVQPPYRTSHVFAHGLRSLLKDTKLRHRWALAMYIPWGKTHMTEDELALEHRGDLGTDAFGNPKVPRDFLDLLEAKTLVDMRYFLRAGFKQAAEVITRKSPYYVFCVPSFLDSQIISDYDTMLLDVSTRPCPPEMAEEAEELLRFILQKCAQSSDCNSVIQNHQRYQISAAEVREVRVQLKELKNAAGAKLKAAKDQHGSSIIWKANVLHTCACNDDLPLLKIALESIEDENRLDAINSRDEDGFTPLMAAAGASSNVQLFEYLITNGADKNLQDPNGRTALGIYRGCTRSARDFSYAMLPAVGFLKQLMLEAQEQTLRLEHLLMPVNGPTEADAVQSGEVEYDDIDHDDLYLANDDCEYDY